jgi:hypothetical protein
MGRGVVWANKYKRRPQEDDEFNAEVADMTGHMDLLDGDIIYLQKELASGKRKVKMRVFGVWKEEGARKRLEFAIRPHRKRTRS